MKTLSDINSELVVACVSLSWHGQRTSSHLCKRVKASECMHLSQTPSWAGRGRTHRPVPLCIRSSHCWFKSPDPMKCTQRAVCAKPEWITSRPCKSPASQNTLAALFSSDVVQLTAKGLKAGPGVVRSCQTRPVCRGSAQLCCHRLQKAESIDCKLLMGGQKTGSSRVCWNSGGAWICNYCPCLLNDR